MADGSDPTKVQFQAPEGGETPPEGDPPEGDPDPPEDGDGPGGESDGEGADRLGDEGKKALDRWKARAKRAEQELAKAGGPSKSQSKATDDEQSAIEKAEQAVMAKANARIIRSEIRAAASGKLADPKDALTFIGLEQFKVDEDGEVDSDEVAEAIDDLLKQKPYLGAATAKRFQGTGDGGAARKAGKPKQLTQQDLKSMTPEQIDKAREDGRLADLMSGG